MPDYPLNVDPLVAARFGLGGLATGAGAAALVSLLQHLREQRAAPAVDEETDDSTIVLNLPRKHAESLGLVEKNANWQTLTAALLAGGAGAYGGYSLVDKAIQRKREEELRAEMEAAQSEYLDMLLKQSADNEFLALFDGAAGKQTEEGTKVADDPAFGLMDYPLGLGALAFLLGTGGTAYLTKEILDDVNEPSKLLDPGKFSPKGPRVNRIVIRSGEHEPEEAEKAASDAAHAQAVLESCIGVHMDVMSGKDSILGDEKVAAALSEADTSAAEMYKAAAAGHWLISLMDAMPDGVRNSIRDSMLDKSWAYRNFKWVPGMKSFGNWRLNSKIKDMVPSGRGVGNFLSGLGGKIQDGVGDAYDWMKGSEAKTAGVLTSFYGSSLADRIGDSLTAARPEPSSPEVSESGGGVQPPDPSEVIERLKIVAEGDDAREFLDSNRDRLDAVVQQMAEAGQLG